MSARPHGGPGAGGAALHDFSTNANACGPCPMALAAVRAADATRYPDAQSQAVRERLARRHGLAFQRIVVAASASEFIFRFTAWAAREGCGGVAVPVPGYGDYAAAAQAWRLPLRAAAQADLVWACDPGSPLGQPDTTPAAALRAARWAVIDAAYEPLRLQGEPAFDAQVQDAVWRLVTPNKALGLTGVRGAYAIAPAHRAADAEALRELAPSWPLGAHGEALLHAWCDPSVAPWLAASRHILAEWKAAQLVLCRGFGWEVQPSDTSFFAARLPLPEAAVADRLAALRARGVQLRDAASLGLPGHVRLSVQPPDAQQALRAAWEATA